MHRQDTTVRIWLPGGNVETPQNTETEKDCMRWRSNFTRTASALLPAGAALQWESHCPLSLLLPSPMVSPEGKGHSAPPAQDASWEAHSASAGWGFLRESVRLKHWGPDRDREGGRVHSDQTHILVNHIPLAGAPKQSYLPVALPRCRAE